MSLMEPAHAADAPTMLRRLGLTPREAAVVAGVLRGANLVTLAAEGGMSPHTAARHLRHLRHVFTKLGVSSRRELLARLYRGF